MSEPAVATSLQNSQFLPPPKDQHRLPPAVRPRSKLPWLNNNVTSDQLPAQAEANKSLPADGHPPNQILAPSGNQPHGKGFGISIHRDVIPRPAGIVAHPTSRSSASESSADRTSEAHDVESQHSGNSNPFKDQPELPQPINTARSDPTLRPYSSTQSLSKASRKPRYRKWSSGASSRPLNPQQTFTKAGAVLLSKSSPRRESQSQYTPSTYSSTPPSEQGMPATLPQRDPISYERLVKRPPPKDVKVIKLPPVAVTTSGKASQPTILSADKPPTWPMVPMTEMDIKIPARVSSLTFTQPKSKLPPEGSKSAHDLAFSKPPSSLGRYNDGTISRRPTVRGSTSQRSPDVSPKTAPPPQQSPTHEQRDPATLERAVTGLQDLMAEALTVAKEAAHENRSGDVAQILDDATNALRHASTVHGYMTQSRPLQISDSESGDYSSENYISGSDSDADVESDGSSIRPCHKTSNETVPTSYTKSKSGLSLGSPQLASFCQADNTTPLRKSIGSKGCPGDQYRTTAIDPALRQPVVNSAFLRDGKRPASHDGWFSPASSSGDQSITQTPPGMYPTASADSVVHDWAYVKRSPGRRDLRGGSSPVPIQPVVLPPVTGEGTNVILPPESLQSTIQRPRFSLPEIPRSKSVRHVRSSPELPLPPAPTTTPQQVTQPTVYPVTFGDLPSKRYKPHPGASRVFESPYYRTPEREDDVKPVPDRSNLSPPQTRLQVLSPNFSLRHPRRNHISLRDDQNFRLHRYRRQPIAREWNTLRKRITATIACVNTALIGLVAGIYAGEVPKIQYYMGDEHHRVILGNVFLYIGMGVSTLIAWPLPLLHGRKPYTLAALAIAIPLQFPQAIVVTQSRGPLTKDFVGLLLPRVFLGLALGFANVNFLTTLLDMFGASLQSRNPHQEVVVYDDVRRQGGGMGLWLGIWSFCFVGSLSIGFLIGAGITQHLNPAWGFYIIVMLLAAFMLMNVVAPETRRAPYRRSVLKYMDENEKLKRRVARGEVKLHLSQDGPKYWWEEVWAGVKLMCHMLMQPGFFILAIYLAWIYALVVLVTLLLGALLSRNYRWHPSYIGLSVFAVAVGALLAVPLTKANIFSRDRVQPARTDSMTFERRVTWTSHLIRRCLFTFALPIAGLAYVLASPGPSVDAAGPTVLSAIVGFLACLAVAECIGLAMETFDTSDLQPGVNTKHRLQSMESATRRRRTNYSSFPRVCAGLFAAQGFGFFLAAAATGISGSITRAIGAQAATGCMVGILLGMTIFLTLILWRFRSIQVIPNHASGERGTSADWSATTTEQDEQWKPVVIGNPSGKMRRMNVLEMGAWSRWTEIRRLNLLAKEGHHVG